MAKVSLENGTSMEYGYIEPDDFDSTKEYPVLLALPPGAQNRQMVKAGFDLYWSSGGAKGWVVISPVAPAGKFFNQGSEKLIPEFLGRIRKRYKPSGGKFHLAGVSNGGTSAFRVAGLYPEQFHSLLALPGFPSLPKDINNLTKLKSHPIAMFVGEKDTAWIKPMKETFEKLEAMKANVKFEEVKGQGHVIQTWTDGEKLFAILNAWNDKLTK